MTHADPNDQVLANLLAWYREMGVDEVLAEDPIDWLARGDQAPGYSSQITRIPDARQADISHGHREPIPGPAEENTSNRRISAYATPPTANGQARAPQQPAPPTPDTVIADAVARANAAPDLQSLGQALAGFDGCGLKATAKNACFYRGAECAVVMVIGEAPGRDEDLAGIPFVGRAGQLLDKMLASIGLDETSVHITNTVYWRPPGNRTPTPQEIMICRPFLERQVALVQPSLLLLLGGAAAKSVFDTTDGIMRLRGKWRDVTLGDVTMATIATLHPAYLLRTPAAKRQAWHDLTELKQKLKKA